MKTKAQTKKEILAWLEQCRRYAYGITADETDLAILAKRLAHWNALQGPRVGDWVVMRDGSMRRFTHDWGEDIQTTDPKFGLGSFYLGDGYMSYSGSLDSALAKHSFQDLGETKTADCWFFHHDFWGADRGVHFQVFCKVYRQV